MTPTSTSDRVAQLAAGAVQRLAEKHDAVPPALAGDVAAALRSPEAMQAWRPDPGAPQVRGIAAHDDAAAKFLRTLGEEGKRIASIVRRNARERVDAPPDPARFAYSVACALLPVALARAAVDAQPAAAATAVLAEISRTFEAPGRQLVLLDGRAELRSARGEVLAATPPALPPEHVAALHGCGSALRTYDAQRMLRHFITEAWHRERAGEREPSVLAFRGYEDLAERLGATSCKSLAALREALIAGAAFYRKWPAGCETAGLWTFTYAPATGRRPAFLEVRLGAMLCPYYIHDLDRRDRWLQPILPMPPAVGRHNEHGAQAAFQTRTVRALVEGRRELVEHGGVLLRPDDFRRFAAEVGLPPATAPRVIDRWSDGDGCLERVERDRYTLPGRDPYRAAREFLMRGGLMTTRRAARAATANAKRRRH